MIVFVVSVATLIFQLLTLSVDDKSFFSPVFISSHDFIGEFITSYKELCRGQSQLNIYEVSLCPDEATHRFISFLQCDGPQGRCSRVDPSCCRAKKYRL